MIIESLILLIIKVNLILNPWKLTWIKFCKLPCLIILHILIVPTALAFARIRSPIAIMPVPWFQPAHTTHFFLGFPATSPEAPAWRKQSKPMWCLPLFWGGLPPSICASAGTVAAGGPLSQGPQGGRCIEQSRHGGLGRFTKVTGVRKPHSHPLKTGWINN